MKQLLKLTLWAGLFMGCTQTIAAQSNILGKWVAVDEGDTMFFEFTKDSFLIVSGMGIEGLTEETDDMDYFGGKKFPYDDENDDTVWVDVKFKTVASKPNHLYIIFYHTGTLKPYQIAPVMMEQNDTTLELNFLTVPGDHSDEEGIIYQNETDWKLAEETIKAALNGNTKILTDTFTLVRIKQ